MKPAAFIWLIFFILFGSASAETSTTEGVQVRIKDIARIHGIYDLQLHGYGLIVGLDGTGDSSGATFTVQSAINMMRRFGVDVPQGRISMRNVAAVMVTGELPFFGKTGGRIDVLVSSIGDAKSIAGGTLLAAPLIAPDGRMFVLAQGPVSVGGLNVSTGSSKSQKNHPTVGRVLNGGMILKAPTLEFSSDRSLQVVLHDPDFTTATRVVSAINAEFKGADPPAASAIDASTVKVTMPESAEDVVAFIARMESLTVVPDHTAEVVINERTGTIVIGKDVRITPVAVSHGNLNIKIKTAEEASQPPPLSAGETVIVAKEDLTVDEEEPKMQVIRGGASIDEIVKALNFIGVGPRDMIVILQTIKKAGALHARLIQL